MTKRKCTATFVLVVAACCLAQSQSQGQAKPKPCIDVSTGSTPSNLRPDLVKELSTAITLSGDFEFYETSWHPNENCWTVNVLAMPLIDVADISQVTQWHTR